MSKYTEKQVERFWSKVAKSDPNTCWEWQAGKDRYGYGDFWLKDKSISAHRMSWIITHGDIPDGLWVLHHCDNPPCVNPSHLFLGTHIDNMRDKVAKGRSNSLRGELSPQAELTESQVREIRELYATGQFFQHELAGRFGVHQQEISRIIRSERWQHIDNPVPHADRIVLKVQSASGYKGVTLHRQTGRWQAQITRNNRDFYLGLHDTPEDAHKAYCEAAEKLRRGVTP